MKSLTAKNMILDWESKESGERGNVYLAFHTLYLNGYVSLENWQKFYCHVEAKYRETVLWQNGDL